MQQKPDSELLPSIRKQAISYFPEKKGKGGKLKKYNLAQVKQMKSKPVMSMYANSKECDKARKAYEAGELAFSEGLELEDSPIQENNLEWRMGWIDAYAESK